ncbi:MAG: response regulator [Cyanobacteria bacterium P01_H01_bin.119]
MTSEPSAQPIPPYFLQEAADLLQQLDEGLQKLRQNFDIHQVHGLMRVAHTLKGAAASVGLDAIKTTTHALEDVFRALCTPEAQMTAEVERLIFEAYDCLKLLLSARLDGAQIDEADVLDRMAAVVTQLQTNLGDDFGQEGYLPSSTDLGFDLTQSIFEVGVAQHLEDLAAALKASDPPALKSLLQSQADIFIGLSESVGLSGFGTIAQTTLKALNHSPDQVAEIARVALDDYRSGQAQILAGDRTEGGQPSLRLRQFAGDSPQRQRKAIVRSVKRQPPIRSSTSVTSKSAKRGLLGGLWHWLSQPIGSSPKKPTAKPRTSQPAQVRSSKNRSSVPPSQANPTAGSAQPRVNKAVVNYEAKLSLDDMVGGAEQINDLVPAAKKEISQPSFTPSSDFTEGLDLSSDSAKVESSLDKSSTAPEPTHTNLGSATVRIPVYQLEQINRTVGDLLTQQNRQALFNEQLFATTKALLTRLSEQQQQLYGLQSRASQYSLETTSLTLKPAPSLAAAQFSKSQALSEHQFDALELDHYSEQQFLIQGLLESVVQQTESTEAIEFFIRQTHQVIERQQRLVANLRESILDARMQPLSIVFQRFPQAIERLVEQYNKPVVFKDYGGEELVDKVIANQLYDPLLHLLRNAFDHGIEAPEMRKKLGKTSAAQINLQASREGRHLLIKVWDNGQGLSLKTIRQKAIDSQLITAAEAANLTQEQTINLLFEAGFSTVDQANDLSGRGIGLNAVRAQIQALNGQINVTYRPGQGTCFALRIPANLTITKLLLCQVNDKVYAVMMDAIEQILVPQVSQLKTWEQGTVFSWKSEGKDHLVPIKRLSEVLRYSTTLPKRHQSKPNRWSNPVTNPVLLLRHQAGFIGLEVDQLLGEQELFIQGISGVMAVEPYLYGCSVLPSGRLTLVIDTIALVQKIAAQSAPQTSSRIQPEKLDSPWMAAEPLLTRESVLIVDDSITVRGTLTKTLQNAGYDVLQAKDGAEAIRQLRQSDVAIVLCDIEMPGMNGFEFLKARQQDSKIKEIPTVMLTSRTGSKHRLLASELGATDYLTKPYLGPQILETLDQILHPRSDIHPIYTTGDDNGQ